jgi:hypothetical protein
MKTPQIAAATTTAGQPPLTIAEKMQWNGFLDYLKKRGIQGSAALDNRDTNMGQQLMDEYRKQDPHFTLTYDRVPDVQNDLQTYRQQLVQKYKQDPTIINGIKGPDEIMPNLSPVDGWLGSKTSQQRYPGAALTQSDGSKIDYGVNQAAYDAAIANMKKVK